MSAEILANQKEFLDAAPLADPMVGMDHQLAGAPSGADMMSPGADKTSPGADQTTPGALKRKAQFPELFSPGSQPKKVVYKYLLLISHDKVPVLFTINTSYIVLVLTYSLNNVNFNS